MGVLLFVQTVYIGRECTKRLTPLLYEKASRSLFVHSYVFSVSLSRKNERKKENNLY